MLSVLWRALLRVVGSSWHALFVHTYEWLPTLLRFCCKQKCKRSWKLEKVFALNFPKRLLLWDAVLAYNCLEELQPCCLERSGALWRSPSWTGRRAKPLHWPRFCSSCSLSVLGAYLQPLLQSREQFSLGEKDWVENGDVFSNKNLIKNV